MLDSYIVQTMNLGIEYALFHKSGQVNENYLRVDTENSNRKLSESMFQTENNVIRTRTAPQINDTDDYRRLALVC